MRDEEMWLWWGRYGISALYFAIEHSLSKKPRSEYEKRPILSQNFEDRNASKESQEEVAVFEMKQRIKALRMQGLPESPV